MKLQQQDLNTHGQVPLLSYKLDSTVGMKPETMSNSINVDINTQMVKSISSTIFIFVLVFNTGSRESLIRFLTLLDNIIKIQTLKTWTQMYAMTKNLLEGEALHLFE